MDRDTLEGDLDLILGPQPNAEPIGEWDWEPPLGTTVPLADRLGVRRVGRSSPGASSALEPEEPEEPETADEADSEASDDEDDEEDD